MEEKEITSFDGTKIAYQITGNNKSGTIILANGLGGRLSAWTPILERFKNQYRFIAWDYRGTFNSDTPDNYELLGVEDHCKDLKQIVRVENIDRFILGGWSMGVQVALEYAYHHREQVRGLILLNGTYGHPFKTAFRSPISRFALPRLTRLAYNISPVLTCGFRAVQQVPESVIFFGKLTGMFSSNIDNHIVKQVVKEYAGVDFKNYFALFLHLDKHTAKNYLSSLVMPTLLIAGSKDMMTPPEVTETMLSLMPNASLLKVPGGTHYSLLEYPELILERLKKFLESVDGKD